MHENPQELKSMDKDDHMDAKEQGNHCIINGLGVYTKKQWEPIVIFLNIDDKFVYLNLNKTFLSREFNFLIEYHVNLACQCDFYDPLYI